MQHNPSSIPNFHSLLNNIEAVWLSSSHRSFQLQKRLEKDNLPLSASSSGSTDVMGRKTPPPSSIDENTPTKIVDLPPSPSASSRRDYWNVVMDRNTNNNANISNLNFSNENQMAIHSNSSINPTSHQSIPAQSHLSRSEQLQHASSSSASHVQNSSDSQAEKPYACPSCPLRFRKRCNLMTHISNVHEKVRPFYCSLCLRRFARKSNCAKHMRLVHHLPNDRIQVRRVHQQ